MICFPNCKINIGLNITEKRNDGFHNIETIFYPIHWCDILEFVPSSSNITTLNISGMDIPVENNLVIKAYDIIAKDFKIPSIDILLHKNIPSGAGLGGGSADAAFMIKLINKSFGLNLSNETMKNYASQLGSDCSFFIENKPLFAYKKGDYFEDISLDLSKYFIIILKPSIHISTADAYAGVKPIKDGISLKQLIQNPMYEWKNSIKNDFELTLFSKYPYLEEIKTYLYQKGAIYASMSGSGSSIYGIFDKEINLKQDFPNVDYFGAFLSK